MSWPPIPPKRELRLGKPGEGCPRLRVCLRPRVPGKRFVYILKNADQPPKCYVGVSTDVGARVSDHNMGRCPHTSSRRPWRRHVVIEFADESAAIAFERYLKSGAGRAFAKRHFEAA